MSVRIGLSALVVSFSLAIAPAAWAEAETGLVSADSVELRVEPKEKAKSTVRLSHGRMVSVLDHTADGQWIKIKGEFPKGDDIVKFEGWIQTKYVRSRGRYGFSFQKKDAPSSGGSSGDSGTATASGGGDWDSGSGGGDTGATTAASGGDDWGGGGASGGDTGTAAASGGDDWGGGGGGGGDTGASGDAGAGAAAGGDDWGAGGTSGGDAGAGTTGGDDWGAGGDTSGGDTSGGDTSGGSTDDGSGSGSGDGW